MVATKIMMLCLVAFMGFSMVRNWNEHSQLCFALKNTQNRNLLIHLLRNGTGHICLLQSVNILKDLGPWPSSNFGCSLMTFVDKAFVFMNYCYPYSFEIIFKLQNIIHPSFFLKISNFLPSAWKAWKAYEGFVFLLWNFYFFALFYFRGYPHFLI